MADLGKVVVTDGGNYAPGTTYEKLTFVHYGSNTYMTLKTVTDIVPVDDGVNYKLFCRSAELATATIPGTVKPDGITTTVDETTGALSAKPATQSTAGIVKGSAGIKVGEDGSIDVNTLFTQATELANIIAGEAFADVLGKISKLFATTMNLDQNALLKSMMTSIDTNDATKVPTSALIHTLYERIGMGESLDIGSNLTALVKALNSNLVVVKTFEVLITTSATKDTTSNSYIGSGNVFNSTDYPSGKTVYAVIAYGARSTGDAGRSALVSYRAVDGFVAVNSPNQGSTEFRVQIAVLYKN